MFSASEDARLNGRDGAGGGAIAAALPPATSAGAPRASGPSPNAGGGGARTERRDDRVSRGVGAPPNGDAHAASSTLAGVPASVAHGVLDGAARGVVDAASVEPAADLRRARIECGVVEPRPVGGVWPRP